MKVLPYYQAAEWTNEEVPEENVISTERQKLNSKHFMILTAVIFLSVLILVRTKAPEKSSTFLNLQALPAGSSSVQNLAEYGSLQRNAQRGQDVGSVNSQGYASGGRGGAGQQSQPTIQFEYAPLGQSPITQQHFDDQSGQMYQQQEPIPLPALNITPQKQYFYTEPTDNFVPVSRQSVQNLRTNSQNQFGQQQNQLVQPPLNPSPQQQHTVIQPLNSLSNLPISQQPVQNIHQQQYSVSQPSSNLNIQQQYIYNQPVEKASPPVRQPDESLYTHPVNSLSIKQYVNQFPEPIPSSKHPETEQYVQLEQSPNLVLAPQHFKIEACVAEEELTEGRTACCSNPKFPAMGGIDVLQLHFQEPGTLPVLGNPDISANLQTSAGSWEFLFVSTENRDIFLQNPWKYAPAWGGYCAYGISFEEKSFDPDFISKLGPFINLEYWLVYNDRLFFFGGEGPRMKFMADIETGLQLGDLHWMSFYRTNTPLDGHFDTSCFHQQTYEDLAAGVRSPSNDHKKNRNQLHR